MPPKQQLKTEKDLQHHKNHQDCRWTAALTSAKCIALYIGIVFISVIIGLIIWLFFQTALEYYATIKNDPVKLEAFVSSMFAQISSFLLGAIPPIVYIYRDKQK